MPRNPGSTTLQLGLSALLIVLVQGLLWGQSVGFGSAIEDWQHAAGSVGSAFGSQLSIQFSAQAAHGLQCGAEALLAVLALVLLFELTRSLPAALQGAMVLATSPHQAEFATVLSTRPLLLFGVCGMAVLVSWARFRSSGRKLWWAYRLFEFRRQSLQRRA